MSSDIRSLLHSAADGTPPTSRRAASRWVLEGCWPLLRDAVEPKFAEQFAPTLHPVSRAGRVEEMAAARAVLSKERAVLQAFSGALYAEFKTAIDDFLAHKNAAPEGAIGGLQSWSLVDFGEMEFKTAIETGSNRIRNAIESTYASVIQRLANMVQELDLREAETPFRPALVLRAVYTALRVGEVTDENVLRALVQRFEAPLTPLLASAYQAIDRYLESKGVSAEVDIAAIARSGVSANQVSPRGPRFSSASGASADDVLRVLYERLGGEGGSLPAAAPAAMVSPHTLAALSGLTGSLATPEAADTAGAPATLTGLPRLPASLELAPMDASARVAPGLIDASLLAAITELQKLGTLAVAALKQGVSPPAESAVEPAQARSALVQKAPRQVDKLTIEIVGLLFDRVNRDAYVPQKIKDLLQQLQYPLIKVALVDPELFASGEHPARRLIDRIASTAVGWDDQGEDNARYFDAASRAVNEVLSAEEEVVSACVRALDEFEAYLASEHARDDDPVARARRALQEAESREIMVINATIKIRRAFETVQLESYLRDFLLKTWPRVLVAAALRDKSGPAGAAAKAYLSIVPDLVWSVQPKLTPEDRKRLVGTIPNVLTMLRQGLTLVEWSKDEMQQFFNQLMNSHSQALKALDLVQGAATPVFETSTLRIKLDGVERLSSELADDELTRSDVHVADSVVRQALVDNDAPIEHMGVPTSGTEGSTEPNGTAPLSTRERSAEEAANALMSAMQCKQWFVLDHDGVSERLQLRWVSPLRTLFLFTAGKSSVGRSLSSDAILALVRRGAIRPVEEAPLFDRAVKDVLLELRSASSETAQAPSTSVPAAG